MSAAVRPRCDLERPADVLDVPPDHREPDMAGLQRTAGVQRVDADSVIVDLDHDLLILAAHEDVDPGRARVLDRVDDELLGDPQQDGGRERLLVHGALRAARPLPRRCR